ncbi:uncharacterized protein [Aristolochia californica]|uniref:uncharacterized protein n=1 Tax=Aristolochia californica TaxID=171875 RepID=UPI0035DF0EC0
MCNFNAMYPWILYQIGEKYVLVLQVIQLGFLFNTRTIFMEEQLAYFYLTVGQQQSYSVTLEMFEISNWTIITYFNKVLDGIANYNLIISSDFQDDCIGAIDGIHIKAHILFVQQIGFWNRKSFISQNVMVICIFDMQFNYILAGWEELASDLRVLQAVLTKRDKYVFEGKSHLSL